MPNQTDLKPASNHSSEAEIDSLSQISSEDDDQKFFEEIEKLEEDLKEAEMERDDAVAMANEKYHEMLELPKR